MTPEQLVAEQAEDEGLWFIAQTAPEGYLQQELRRLHEAVEWDAERVREGELDVERLAEAVRIVGGSPDWWLFSDREEAERIAAEYARLARQPEGQ